MIPNDFLDIFVQIVQRLAEIERRFENRERTGTITEVDYAKGLARAQIDDDKGQPFLTPWAPWEEVALGAIKTHFPPAVGEQVKFVSESGDITDGVFRTSLPSNANQRCHDKGGEAKIQIGETSLLMTGDKIVLSSAALKFEGGRIDHDQRGGGSTTGVPTA